jgi:hypothetical protein
VAITIVFFLLDWAVLTFLLGKKRSYTMKEAEPSQIFFFQMILKKGYSWGDYILMPRA